MTKSLVRLCPNHHPWHEQAESLEVFIQSGRVPTINREGLAITGEGVPSLYLRMTEHLLLLFAYLSVLSWFGHTDWCRTYQKYMVHPKA